MRTIYDFGPFRLDTEAQVLTHDGVATALGARGVAVLAALVGRAGEYVDKSALVDAAWPGLVVEENNLAVQISAIRRVLARVPEGELWVETLTRRGYRFVGPVIEHAADPELTQPSGQARVAVHQGGGGRAPQPLRSDANASTAVSPLSILVLPFANHTGVESKAYIADALTTSITSDLTRIADLLVVPAITAFTYKERSLTLPSVSREAGVRFVLQGSVMASGRRLRIACQLVDASTGSQLWNETFEGQLKTLFALLDRVTARVGNSMYKPMVIAAASESDRQLTDDSVADLLLRARALAVQTQSPQRFSEIESIYRQILQLDSANLAAMEGLAATLAVHADWLSPADPAQTQMFTEARDLALAVRAMDPPNSGAYIPIALHAQHVSDFETARNAWEAALRLNPNGPGAHTNLAVFHLYMGEPALAIPLLKRSLELNPRANANVFAALGAAYFALGQNDGAIGWILRALDMGFEHLDMYSFLAMAYANIGNAEKSAAFAQEYRKRADSDGVKGPRVSKPKPGTPAAYVSYFYGKLLPDWERAGLP